MGVAPTFANPWALLLLVTLPALVWQWRRRRHAALTFPSVEELADLPVGRARIAQRGSLTLRLAGLLLLILAVAGPRWPDEGSRISMEGISIAIVLDASHSMAESDFVWGQETVSRFEAAKKVFRLLVEGGPGLSGERFPGRPQDLMALVVFATRPETACPLTLDHAALLKILDAEEPRSIITEATTNPGDALAWALYALQKAPTRRQAIILLTDGESNVPSPALKPRQAAQLAGNLRIPIYAIDAAPANISEGDAAKAKETLEEIAKLTQGRYFRASDGAALTEALSTIDRLERDAIQSFQYWRYHEGYPWFALGALLCWLAALGLEATWWRRVP
jgi:Ca-activated chloride channel family protein